MKKVAKYILVGALSLSSLGCSKPLESIIVSVPAVQRVPRFNSLGEIQKYLQFNIRYVNDFRKSKEGIRDYWQCAEETLELKVGDCDDIAILGSYFAEDFNYPPMIMLLKNTKNKDTHSVTFLQKFENYKLKYGIIDKNFFVAPQYSSFPELVNAINFRGDCKWNSYELILLTPGLFLYFLLRE